MKSTSSSNIEESFELRWFSSDPKANGESDFKGETSVVGTPDRIHFLETYADVACSFFDDPHLDRPAVTGTEVADAIGRLRPQPLTSTRERIVLNKWRGVPFATTNSGLPAIELPDGVVENSGGLAWQRQAVLEVKFAPQMWRSHFWISLALANDGPPAIVEIGGGIVLTLQCGREPVVNGQPLPGVPKVGASIDLKVEVDASVPEGRFNLFADGIKIADWLPVASPSAPVQSCKIQGEAGLRVKACRGLCFLPRPVPDANARPDEPYDFHPLFSYDLPTDTDPTGWETATFDDSAWPFFLLPCVRGGIFEAGQDMLLRTLVSVPRFERALLNVEAMDPGGEIWINGHLAYRNDGPHAFAVEVGRWLVPGAVNLIAARLYHRREVPIRMRHTSTDRHTGWFFGRAHLDLHQEIFLEELFVHATELTPSAKLAWQVCVRHERWGSEESEPKADLHFAGRLRVEVMPWYPDPGEVCATGVCSIRLNFHEPLIASGTLEIPHPELWSPTRPFLYKVRIVLEDGEGREIDDLLTTTGLRTVSQEGGVLHLNDEPYLLLGGLLFGTRAPIEEQSKWLRCGTEAHLVSDVLATKALRGNAMRISIHDGPAGGINDPRLAEIGDQLGILFIWTTTELVRTSSPWQIDFDGLASDIRHVRNHPSIIMWQPGNHPRFESWDQDGARWFSRVVETILDVDPSRLISPTANFDRLDSPDDTGEVGRDGRPLPATSAWTHPMVVRGNMETPTGYGHEWGVLRKWPDPPDWSGEQGWIRSGYRREYLASRTHAYFDFESEESNGQPNWNLLHGQPFHQIRSYEFGTEEGSIGRNLEFSEWRVSQAWQAFSAYEAYRKKRTLDYDGLFWCSVDGGANSGTYEKPLTDPLGHKKLVFHSVRMAFSPTLAGSADVDVSYGPSHAICPVILHIGETRTVTLVVVVATPAGQELISKTYPDIVLPGGRSRTDLEPWPRPALPDGIYVVLYRLLA